MKLAECGKVLTEEILAKFEEKLNVILPNSYKEFMLKNNGGTPVGNWGFDFVENGTNQSTGSLISYFEKIYSENTMEPDDMKMGYKSLLETEQIPVGYLPIADDPFGNIIFLCVDEENYGSVYFGNQELEVPETGYLVMSLIADDFQKFVDSLYLLENE